MHHTYHIHINGMVQGVGFRPFICRLADEMSINGWVNNTNDGVHIEITASDYEAYSFYLQVTEHPPVHAFITQHNIHTVAYKEFDTFTILESSTTVEPELLLTPDIAICDQCRFEINHPKSKRHGYAFTTCLNCGPRYSITRDLPYDRKNTTMQPLQMCESCTTEYQDLHDRRYYSQTNSCTDCAIQMHWYMQDGTEILCSQDEILNQVNDALKNGDILAIKGIGGYLLMCDATRQDTIKRLRTKKHRPAKPLAVLYPDIEMIRNDVDLRPFETAALKDHSAPIVVCKKNGISGNDICTDAIAPGLNNIGVMLPGTPLLTLIAENFGKPLIATSGNISGSPIIYTDPEALDHLLKVAEFALTYDREILVPQDDSVMKFNEHGMRILLRRSRGLAPNYYPNPFHDEQETILATGGEIKSAFAFLNKKNIFISQYLGDQAIVESQESYSTSMEHFFHLLHARPTQVLVDLHPNYFVSQMGRRFAASHQLPPAFEIQHHKAHFGAVLAENNLLQHKEPVLGFTWDGSGYGEDGQIWGSEIFLYQDKEMKRCTHLNYFPMLMGDKMSNEPRLSALSLLKNFPEKQQRIKNYFTATEWSFYQKALNTETTVQTSSMGRFLDGLACIAGIKTHNSFEGEAALQIESLAAMCEKTPDRFYHFNWENEGLDWKPFLNEFLEDLEQQTDTAFICKKIIFSLAKCIAALSHYYGVKKIAFSGGVFQNDLLTDFIIRELHTEKDLYFHQQLSPNDECIGFGQLAVFEMIKQSSPLHSKYQMAFSN